MAAKAVLIGKARRWGEGVGSFQVSTSWERGAHMVSYAWAGYDDRARCTPWPLHCNTASHTRAGHPVKTARVTPAVSVLPLRLKRMFQRKSVVGRNGWVMSVSGASKTAGQARKDDTCQRSVTATRVFSRRSGVFPPSHICFVSHFSSFNLYAVSDNPQLAVLIQKKKKGQRRQSDL